MVDARGVDPRELFHLLSVEDILGMGREGGRLFPFPFCSRRLCIPSVLVRLSEMGREDIHR